MRVRIMKEQEHKFERSTRIGSCPSLRSCCRMAAVLIMRSAGSTTPTSTHQVRVSVVLGHAASSGWGL